MWNVDLSSFDVLCGLQGNASFKSYSCSFDEIDLGFEMDESIFEMEPYVLYRPKKQNIKKLKS
jgi:hypothetical protein